MAHSALPRTAEGKFSFEDLEIWQEAVEFADRCLDVVDRISDGKKHHRLLGQLESAAVSPALNIAEGKGRYSRKEFAQFLYVARGSLFEAATLLLIFRKRKWIEENEYLELKMAAIRLGRRISTLINAVRRSSQGLIDRP
jgi:four helix bundle protein